MSDIKQKGSSTVEFAIMLPLLLLLIVMVSEFGVMFYRLNALNKSVQIAARYLSEAAINNCYLPADRTIARNLAVYGNVAGTGSPVVPGLAPSDIKAFPLPVCPTGTNHISVSVTYNSNFILGNSMNALMRFMVTGGAGGGAPTGPMTLKAASVMRFVQ